MKSLKKQREELEFEKTGIWNQAIGLDQKMAEIEYTYITEVEEGKREDDGELGDEYIFTTSDLADLMRRLIDLEFKNQELEDLEDIQELKNNSSLN